MPSVILTTQPPATLSAVPNQNTTFSVVASADFRISSYTYQWRQNGSNISGATTASYEFEPALADNGKTYTCLVSGLSSNGTGQVAQAYVVSTGLLLNVTVDTSIYSNWTPKPGQPNLLNESGKERFLRMRNLGYC
jgi:hypothetical protein